MKTERLLIIALLALELAWSGCGNKANQVPVVTKSAPTGPVELLVKWPLGRNAVQSMDMTQTMAMTIPGMPQQMTNEMTMGQSSSLTVVKETDSGKLALEMEYLNSKMAVTTGGRPVMSYDSAKSSADDTNPAAAIFGKIIGAKIRFVLDQSNRVESVEGAEELAQRLPSSPKLDPAGTLKSMFSSDMLKQAVDFEANLPDHPVQPGDSWPVHHEFAMGALGTMVLDSTNTLDSWERRHERYCAHIETEGTITFTPGDTAAAAGMKGVKFTAHDGKTSGETWFDLDLGMFTDTSIEIDMGMDITIPNPGSRRNANLPKTMTISSTINQTINTKFELK